jgi:glycosyltransferase involved in cell wall biosynthesis
MAQRPSISLVIGTYNRGPRIARTLDSVLGQTVPPAEIVVIDDGSTDDTGAWVACHYPQVRVVRTVNGGTSAARNHGAQEARSEVLMFLDHDDELLPHAVEVLSGLLQKYPEARAAHADHTYTNTVTGLHYNNHHTEQPAFHRMGAIPVRRSEGDTRLYGGEMYHALLRGNLLQQPWAIYRDTFLQVGGFATDVRYCEDWDMYLRVTRAAPVAVSDQVISHHLVEGTNLHLARGQEEMHMRVLRRQLGMQRWYNLSTRLLLRRRLGQYYKSAGDELRQTSVREAWRQYARSLAAWPFDHVVALRTAWWPVRMMLGR